MKKFKIIQVLKHTETLEMTGITKDELIQMVRGAARTGREIQDKIAYLIRAKAILVVQSK